MTNAERIRPVVVGVDGSDYALLALDWAADEAAQHGWPLRIVNAYQSYAAAVTGVTVSLPSPPEESGRILTEARDRVIGTYPGLAVSTAQHEGPTPRVLLREGTQGRMLVVGREGIGRLAELALGSVSLAVATRAAVPVIVVPSAWKRPPEPYGRIVVGVDGSENCDAAVGFAFQVAAERDSELVAVLAWYQPTRWPDGRLLSADEPRLMAEYYRILAEATARWEAEYPQVKVTGVTDIGHPAEALARRSAEADLVVIGGRGHGTVTGMLLGSAARAILRHVDRPIAVVHQPAKS
jgi:nucleotide-binding universal stress UspA family protein